MQIVARYRSGQRSALHSGCARCWRRSGGPLQRQPASAGWKGRLWCNATPSAAAGTVRLHPKGCWRRTSRWWWGRRRGSGPGSCGTAASRARAWRLCGWEGWRLALHPRRRNPCRHGAMNGDRLRDTTHRRASCSRRYCDTSVCAQSFQRRNIVPHSGWRTGSSLATHRLVMVCSMMTPRA